ncbi:MAG: 50S ribosomal protein L2 [Pseudomonadota bacterium]|nr:50S ribosomal protein L2 [Pseudomonadota bacterium]
MITKIVACKPTTPGQRNRVVLKHTHVANVKPRASLIDGAHKTSNGRNAWGRITTRHRSAALHNRRKYRIVDFKRNKDGVIAKVKTIEYCPFRTAHLALLSYRDGEWRYIVATDKMREGDEVASGDAAPIKEGNCLPIYAIPQGSVICMIEMKPGKGAQLARSAGTSAVLVTKSSDYSVVRLKSGETRKIPSKCRAVLGVVSNTKHNLRKLGKAGAKRWVGIRPTVRGVAMNPIDHPHGGGEGRTSGGRHPVSPTGKQTKGMRTRRCKRTNSMILKRRNQRK